MSPNLPAETITKKIQDKIKAIKAPTILNQWQFKIVDLQATPAEPAGDGWQTVSIPYSWSSADGEGWFHLDFHLPTSIEGLDILGSKIEFELFLPIGAVVFLDGKEMYREPSWTDTRGVRVVLIESFRESISFSLEVRCNKADGLAQLINSSLYISKLSEVIFDLDLVSAQINFCQFLAEKGIKAGRERTMALEEALASLELAALDTRDWARWWASVNTYRTRLAIFEEEAKTYTSHLVAHSHIDMNWLWPMLETIEVCRRDFSTMTALMDTYPEFHFSQSQAATYYFMEVEHPELFERIRKRVEDGHWDVTASTWVEGDLNMAAGESLLRQLLHARRYIRTHFGVEPLICWEPDTFGHSASLPQLLKKSGIEFYYFCRAGKGHPLFWWEGIDGSRLLAVQDLHSYWGPVTPSSITDSIVEFAGRYGSRQGLFVYGVGDHGGGATVEDILATRAIQAASFMPNAQPGPAATFYQDSLSESPDLPAVTGELNTTFEGCYTSHGDIKRLNRQCENQLLSAESALALSALQASFPTPGLAEEWRTLCFHQFHDILCGCAISVTYREAHQRLNQVLSSAQGKLEQSLDALAEAADTGTGEGVRIVIFNPLAWERDDIVRLSLDKLKGKTPTAIVDETGHLLPIQISEDGLVFIVEGLPGLGLKVYRLVYDREFEGESRAQANPAGYTMENGLLRLHVNPITGEVDGLEDLIHERNLLSSSTQQLSSDGTNPSFLNRLVIDWEKPHAMSAWNIGEISHSESLPPTVQARVIESGPVRSVVETQRQVLHSTIRQQIILYRKLRRIDFVTDVDWHEHGSMHASSPMLRTVFTPCLEAVKPTFEIPFAGLERPADGREVPALRWVDLSTEDGNYGLSLLNDCKYGHQAAGSAMSITLLRASYEPDINPDEGLHHFTYSLYPHAGDWRQAQTIRYAAELNQPLQFTLTGGHPGKIITGEPCLECCSESVLASAFKLAEDQPLNGKAYILRLYETHGLSGSAIIKFGFPVVKVLETDLIENEATDLPIDGNEIKLDFSHHEVKTLKVYS
jgi:alpha-mannosidase